MNEGDAFTLTGDVVVSQASNLVDATAGMVDTGFSITPGNADTGNAVVSGVAPSDGRWRLTTLASVISITGESGIGNDNAITLSYNGGTLTSRQQVDGITITLTSTSGTVLDTAIISVDI